MEYHVDDQKLEASTFLSLVSQVWPGDYDLQKTQAALHKTQNITAYDGRTLVGCLRLLTDSCFFGTITELLVLPEYQGQDPKQIEKTAHLDFFPFHPLTGGPACRCLFNYRRKDLAGQAAAVFLPMENGLAEDGKF